GRLGDIFGRVKMYNAGFAIFAAASILLSVDPFHASAGALWLIGWRIVQASGGAMLTGNSAAILTDAVPSHHRGMAPGINQITALAGQFLGLLAGGLLAALDWRAVFWVSVPVGVVGTIWSYRSLREIGTRTRARVDWLGTATFTCGLGLILTAMTYGIQPYGGHPTGGTNPPVLGALAFGLLLLGLFGFVESRGAAPMFPLGPFRALALLGRHPGALVA